MTQIGSVYAQALYSLAREEGLDEAILEQLKVLDQSFAQEPDFLKLLAAPNLTKEERCGVIDSCFKSKVHEYVCSFLKILMEKGYIRRFPDCVEAYRQYFNEDHGILRVTAVTAVALTDAQRDKLCGKLAQTTGKTIDLINRVDPSCIGGVRLDYDGKRLDDTVSHRLDAVRGLLKNTVL